MSFPVFSVFFLSSISEV
uniref:Uncharacterized protein n=1 Tax=Anguilla anguilla TaxID=7936 RepID=A0A0E9SDI8_ANGAN